MYLDSIYKAYSSIVKIYVNESYVCLMRLSKGGVAFLIKKKSLVFTVKKIHIYSDRVFSVYLPADGKIDYFAFEFNIVKGLHNMAVF